MRRDDRLEAVLEKRISLSDCALELVVCFGG
jgi:hypothetical protein